jgi:Insect cuticle protein
VKNFVLLASLTDECHASVSLSNDINETLSSFADENEPHSGDGRYRYKYLTGNGIMAQEEGYLNNPGAQYPDYPEQVAVGSYSYTAPDGQLISLTYKADANGFQPEGAHLPTPPSLPAEYYE